jgi:ATP-dependent RNA helicase HelY
MSSPAERFEHARRRQAEQRSVLGEFRSRYPFGLDPFQVAACEALESGKGVLVAAPTGAGKTIVGEFAVHLALAEGRKCFYTTPIKALSNQKFADLSREHGADVVGLLTGDNTINGDAPVVVMTTEVLRNMLYASSTTLTDLGYVVMDEVHYLADRFRGAVWEEVIIHLPESVRLVSLSATVSNAEEFGEWLATVRGDTEVIVSEHRPVPLWQHVLAGRRLYDLFTTGPGEKTGGHLEVNPELVQLARDSYRFNRGGGGRGRVRRGGRDFVSRPDVVERLESSGLLPAIEFIFSRAGCDAAVTQCLHAGLRLLSHDERLAVRAHVRQRTAHIAAEDLDVLGFHEWADALERGVAAHHAGMLPTFKEVVEELFTQGLVKVVFATETLALGINMPARSVVLESLVKWNGETHADITPGEYTQLTGRAGRRGIDVEGHAVVLWRSDLDPRALAGLAGTRTYPLRSSFKPSYNMAVNLVGQVGRNRSRALLETSFAQFQADAAVVGLNRQLRRNKEALSGYRDAMTCHLGDFPEYAELRRALSDRESELSRAGAATRRAAAVASLEKLREGDVILVPAGRRAGLAVVLDPGAATGLDGPRPAVLTTERQVVRLSMVDFPTPVEPLTRMRVPKTFNQRSAQQRRDLAASLREHAAELPPELVRRPRRQRAAAADDAEIARLRAAIRRHPCHGCDQREDHARWAERYHRLHRETEQLERRIRGRTHTIARTFDRVCAVLDELGYTSGDTVTPRGRTLRRIYTELDLLAAECLRAGLWRGLRPAELAACVAALVYESRASDDGGPPRLPGGRAADALGGMATLWARLDEVETRHNLDFLRAPDLGFSWAAFRWAQGKPLETVLLETDLQAGDFVRWTKQLIDLLGQIVDAAGQLGSEPDQPADRGADDAAGSAAEHRDGEPDDTSADPGAASSLSVQDTARKAIDALRRGVVAYSSLG